MYQSEERSKSERKSHFNPNRNGVSLQKQTTVGASVLQRARIVKTPAFLGFHHWELQYGGDEESGLGEKGQIGVIAASADRDSEGSSAKTGKLADGKALIRVVKNKHLSNYTQVGDLRDDTIDEEVAGKASKLAGKSRSFNQITNNCQDFVSEIWSGAHGSGDPSSYNERNVIVNELTRSPTPEEVEQGLNDMYLYL